MKTIRTLVTTALLLAAASVYVKAESQSLLKASIPFSFTVGDQSFPAGDYTISRVWTQSPDTIRLRSADYKHSSFVLTNASYSAVPSAQAKLIFQHYGGEYFLSQIWTLNQTSGLEVALPNRAKELAQNGSIHDVATVVASASSH